MRGGAWADVEVGEGSGLRGLGAPQTDAGDPRGREFRVEGFGFRVQSPIKIRVEGLGFRVWSLGFRGPPAS